MEKKIRHEMETGDIQGLCSMIGLHVCKWYLHGAPMSMNSSYIGLFGAPGFSPKQIQLGGPALSFKVQGTSSFRL